MIDFSVTIGGQNVSSHIVAVYRDHSLCEGMSSVEIKLDPTWGEAPAFEPYDEIVVQEEGVGTFKGYVTPIAKQRMDPLRTVMGQDATKKIQDTWLTEWEVVANTTPIDALTDLFTESGLVPSQYNFRDSTTDLLPEKEWDTTSAWDVCKEILTMMGWQMWSDGDGVLQIGEITMPSPTHTFQAGVNLINVTRRRDDSYTRNAIAVYGSDNISVKKTQVVPILSDMERAGAFANPLIKTVALAESVAERALHEFNRLLDVKTCEIIGDATVQIADAANVIEGWCYLHHRCLVTGVRSSLDTNGYTLLVTLDERCPTIWGHDSRPRMLYAATDGRGVYRSDDYAESWVAANGSGGSSLSGDALTAYAVEADCRDPYDVWAGTLDGLYRTRNGGQYSWEFQDLGGILTTLTGEEIAVESGGSIACTAIDQDELHPSRLYFLVESSSGSFNDYEAWVVGFSSGSDDSGGSWSQWPIRYK